MTPENIILLFNTKKEYCKYTIDKSRIDGELLIYSQLNIYNLKIILKNFHGQVSLNITIY